MAGDFHFLSISFNLSNGFRCIKSFPLVVECTPYVCLYTGSRKTFSFSGKFVTTTK